MSAVTVRSGGNQRRQAMKVLNATGPDAPNLPPFEDPNQPPGVPSKPKPIDPPQEVPPVKLPPEPVPQP